MNNLWGQDKELHKSPKMQFKSRKNNIAGQDPSPDTWISIKKYEFLIYGLSLNLLISKHPHEIYDLT